MNRRQQKPSNGRIADDAVEQHIYESFEHNYDLLRQEGGHVLAEGTKRQALEQSLMYWRKLKSIATSVTETEVKLALPGQVTPKGRQFVIEGVVDIVRECDEVRMYDLKTHEERDVRAELVLYEDQLNVYAHIWTNIRRQDLTGTAIIATQLPKELREALRSGDSATISEALQAWQPVVDLPFDKANVDRTIADFGRCVDSIEDAEFAPPSLEEIGQPRGMRRRKNHGETIAAKESAGPTFAQSHCQNCDARFSCPSYRALPREKPGRGRRLETAKANPATNYQQELDDWIDANLTDDTQ
ncbi:MAG: PD-(D/E)XK nuclease family protein [Polyangia bacterium]|jgi:hypothetical protein